MRLTATLVVLIVAPILIPGMAAAQSRAIVNANARGNQALDAGRNEAAIKNYQKTLKLAMQSGDVQYQSIAKYGLARASARLCQVAEADQLFRESISLRESISDDPKTAFLTQNWLEYARFLMSRGNTAEAVTYYGKAIPRLESNAIERIDPIGYSLVLDDYAVALLSVEMVDESRAFAQRATELRQKYPDRQPGFRATPYPADCRESAPAPNKSQERTREG